MSSPRIPFALAAILLAACSLPALAQQDKSSSRSIRIIEKAPEATSPAGEQPARSSGPVGQGSGATAATPPVEPAKPAAPVVASPPPQSPPAQPSTAAVPPVPAKAAPAVPAAPAPQTETAKLPNPAATPAATAPASKPAPAGAAAPKVPVAPSPVTVTFLGKDRFGLGDSISVQVRSQIAGYLVLVDVSSDGRIQQIYPNVYSMAASGADAGNGNYIKAGEQVTVPDPASPLANFEYLAGPPFGEGRLFAILSDKPVQYIDLPDLPAEVKGEQVAGYVQQATRSLRITPAGDGPLLDPRWSFGVATYVVEARTTDAKP